MGYFDKFKDILVVCDRKFEIWSKLEGFWRYLTKD